MEKKNNFQISMFIPIGIGIIWVIAFLIYQNSPNIGSDYWIAFVFGLIGIAASELSIILRSKSNSSTLEIGAVSIVYTVIFTIIVLVLNMFFAFMQKHEFAPIFVILNLIILFVYGLLIYYSNKNLLRANELTEYSAGKMGNVADISQQLATLISISSDDEVKKELVKLKEKVDYSNNVSQNYSKEQEEVFLQKIYSLQDDISNGVAKDIVVNKIKDASVTWSSRNSRVNTIK